MHKYRVFYIFLLVFASVLAFNSGSMGTRAVHAQLQPSSRNRPIDMMVVLDNSCSMFPAEQIVPGCEVFGNDPDFLRIIGGDLIIARLGFSEANEEEYQLGIISLGDDDDPRPFVPLQPLKDARDALSQVIANPQPELATKILPALRSAYRELKTSPNRKITNLPAVVLITDGIPYPPEGQSNTDVEQLVSDNPDIPVFVMLLQNKTDTTGEYQQYIAFWQQLQARYPHVFTYRIQNDKQIQETYNTIIAQLQNTIPSQGVTVTPELPLRVFVSRYVQKIVVTVSHPRNSAQSKVVIQDRKGNAVQLNEPGVAHFRGESNPIEVISIFKPRLSDDLKDDYWTISSDAPVDVFFDWQGAYRFNLLEPQVSLTEVPEVFLATERQSPDRELAIRFNLLDENNTPLTERQSFQGKIVYPDGQESSLRIPDDLAPDAAGTYTIRLSPMADNSAFVDQTSRLMVLLNAGPPPESVPNPITITTVRLLVDIGRGPLIEAINPLPLVCTADQSIPVTVTIGGFDTALSGTVQVRVFGGGAETRLLPDTSGVFTGDIQDLCKPLLATLACSTQQTTSMRVRMVAQLRDGSTIPPIEREIETQLNAPACAPTPAPPTPTALPTPVPNHDGDRLNDLADQCPTTWGLTRFNGCLPIWFQIVTGTLTVGVLAFITLVGIPWARVKISPPPKGYVLICQPATQGAPRQAPISKSIYNTGMSKRSSRVTIGGDRKKDHIYVKGLQPAEFVCVRQNGQDVLLNSKGNQKETFNGPVQKFVTTSNPAITLRIGADPRLRC